jgi:GTP cyclohydrolase IB
MNPPTAIAIPPLVSPDVQAQPDERGITIDHVGIRRLRYPILIDSSAGPRPSIAEWELTVELEAHQRGTHMSRFVETIEQWSDQPFNGSELLLMLAALRDRLKAPRARATCAFTLFIERSAPVTGLRAQHPIDCRYDGTSTRTGEHLMLAVRVPITTLCPCSKEISEYGAHNQRGYVEITADVDPRSDLGFLDLVEVAEQSGSAVIYPLLKRSDERYVTMQAYDAPAFVEDVVRDAALGLVADPRIRSFTVEAENHESIHDHSAVASIHWER